MGALGQDHDVVTLTLNDEVVIRSLQFDVARSITTQPCAFGMDIGTGEKARDLMKRYPPGTPFKLAIDGAQQFTGVTDGYTTRQSGEATSFGLRGRDNMSMLIGARAREDKSFSDITYAELVEQVLKLAAPKASWVLYNTNDGNRRATTKSALPGGTPTSEVNDTVIGELENGEPVYGTTTVTGPSQQSRKLRVKAGQEWYGWLKGELDRAGLMLWAEAEGNFVLAAPDVKQPPMARILRKRGSLKNVVTVFDASHRNETTSRFSECIVHMRRGGGAEARAKGFAQYVDQEMIDLGFDRPLVITDTKCKTLAQAEAMARRKVAEARRSSWTLNYEVSGFTTMGIEGSRIVWAPDTVVEVDDDEFGLYGSFWVESVKMSRNPHSSTSLTLMRLEDVLYGSDPDGES